LPTKSHIASPRITPHIPPLLYSNLGQTGGLSAIDFLNKVTPLNLDIPLICAGGIGDEAAFAAALDSGYAGCQLGTRFLATPECMVTDSYKKAIVDSTSEDIVRTNKLAGTWSSVIRTPAVEDGGLEVNWLVAWLLRQPYTKSLTRLTMLTRAMESYKTATFDESHQV
jgi:nitronate monooxygenase